MIAIFTIPINVIVVYRNYLLHQKASWQLVGLLRGQAQKCLRDGRGHMLQIGFQAHFKKREKQIDQEKNPGKGMHGEKCSKVYPQMR